MSMFGDGNPKNLIFEELESIFEKYYKDNEKYENNNSVIYITFMTDVLDCLQWMFGEN